MASPTQSLAGTGRGRGFTTAEQTLHPRVPGHHTQRPVVSAGGPLSQPMDFIPVPSEASAPLILPGRLGDPWQGWTREGQEQQSGWPWAGQTRNQGPPGPAAEAWELQSSSSQRLKKAPPTERGGVQAVGHQSPPAQLGGSALGGPDLVQVSEGLSHS